jgi:energy-coupling factor transport system ATP-binding protein
MEDMASYCDNVIVMEKSRVFRAGRVEDIFSRANDLVEVGLNVPEVSLIAERLRAVGFALEGNLYTVEGVYQALLSRKEGRA